MTSVKSLIEEFDKEEKKKQQKNTGMTGRLQKYISRANELVKDVMGDQNTNIGAANNSHGSNQSEQWEQNSAFEETISQMTNEEMGGESMDQANMLKRGRNNSNLSSSPEGGREKKTKGEQELEEDFHELILEKFGQMYQRMEDLATQLSEDKLDKLKIRTELVDIRTELEAKIIILESQNMGLETEQREMAKKMEALESKME